MHNFLQHDIEELFYNPNQAHYYKFVKEKNQNSKKIKTVCLGLRQTLFFFKKKYILPWVIYMFE